MELWYEAAQSGLVSATVLLTENAFLIETISKKISPLKCLFRGALENIMVASSEYAKQLKDMERVITKKVDSKFMEELATSNQNG